MPEIRHTEQFIEDAKSIRLASKRQGVRRCIERLADLPEARSKRLPDSLVERYGANVRMLVVSSFVVAYEIDADADTVNTVGLIRQRAAK